ncbi:hypothetical protein evm_002086 [Chilo suppressalis]|nr:hypothetical protein evm_002086 [Chilo suppressalis]
MKFIALVILVFAVCGRADDNSTSTPKRQKRAMLFFDENGNLMKSFITPYMQELAKYALRKPENENFLEYFFNFLRPLIINTSTAAFMIPVSQDVVQQIIRDPLYQNKLMISSRGPDYNPLCVGRRTQIPAPSTCRGFLSCWDGWAYELECPEGLMFSSEGYCDYADMVKCKDRASLIPDPASPQCRQDFETFRNELNCNEFFVCVNHKPVKFKCPANLAYSQNLGVCDYPNLVDCSSSSGNPPQAPAIVPTTPSVPTTIPPIPTEPSTTKPIFAQRPVPPEVVNLPSTFPSTIFQQIKKIPDSSYSDNRVDQSNIVPGIPAATPNALEDTKLPDFQFKPKITDGNAIFMQNSVYNNQNWATPVAIMSPQDAVRFLKFKELTDANPEQSN